MDFKSQKWLLACLLLVLIFSYGVVVGKYKLFPYNAIKNSKDLIEIAIVNIKPAVKAALDGSPPSPNSIRFIAYGDTYADENDAKKVISGLLDSINKLSPSLIVHLGDSFGEHQPCTDSMIDLQRELMNTLNAPVLYTPGDNEWRDCYDKTKGDDHNLERLAYIRKTYFSNQQTLGKNPSFVENQGARGYPENARLMKGGVAFITAHVVGSKNNFDPMSKSNTMEYFERDAANIDWVTESFKKYEYASAFVVAIHADMWTSPAPHFHRFSNALYELSNKHEKPVLVLFGDSHMFRVFQPMPEKYPLINAIEVFGYPDLKAIEVEVDPSKKTPFNVIKIISNGIISNGIKN
jgi:hypothetical protein